MNSPSANPLTRFNAARKRISTARKLGTSLTALTHTDENLALLTGRGIHLPMTTLDEYHAQADAVTAHVDAGREPHLVNGELLAMDLHPLVEVWDVAIEKHGDAIMATTIHGDALLSPDTLVFWR